MQPFAWLEEGFLCSCSPSIYHSLQPSKYFVATNLLLLLFSLKTHLIPELLFARPCSFTLLLAFSQGNRWDPIVWQSLVDPYDSCYFFCWSFSFIFYYHQIQPTNKFKLLSIKTPNLIVNIDNKMDKSKRSTPSHYAEHQFQIRKVPLRRILP